METIKPENDATEPSVEAQDANVESTEMLEEKARGITIAPAGEFTDADEDDDREIYRNAALSGSNADLNVLDETLKQFGSTLKRNEDGQIVFKDEQQRDRWSMLRAIVDTLAPSYNTGERVFKDAIESADPSEFTPGVRLDDGRTFTARASAPKKASSIVARLRSRRKSGNEVTLYLPKTGIYVTFTAPHESDYCDYEVQQALDTSSLGSHTYGLLLNAASGVYVESMVDFSLKFVVSTSLDIGDLEIPQALRYYVDAADYGILILGPAIAKFPGGIPWNLIDPDSGEIEEVYLNLVRCIHNFNDRFTPEQRKFYTTNSKPFSVTPEMLAEYSKASRPITSDKWCDKETGLTFYFKDATLDEYFEVTREWVQTNQTRTAEILGNYPTDKERDKHMSLLTETRRLSRYLHRVGAVEETQEDTDEPMDVADATEMVTEKNDILDLLVELSSDRGFVTRFEKALSKYDEDTRLVGYGYMPRKKHTSETVIEEGPMRGFVPLSPDRIFFGLSRAVYEVQAEIAKAYENAG